MSSFASLINTMPPSNNKNPLCSEVVLHNVLTFLPLDSVLNIIVTSTDSKSVALSSPYVCVGTELSPDCRRLCCVLKRFNHIAHLQVQNAELLVKKSDFISFAKEVPNIVQLKLTKLRLNCKTGRSFVEAFRQRFSHLRELSLDGAMFLTDAVLKDMVKCLNGRTLISLSLIGCRTLKDNHVNDILSKCPALDNLSLPDCTRLSTINLTHGNLKYLNLSKCTSITSFSAVRMPLVETILLPFCRNVNKVSVEKIVTYSPHLKYLNIGGCINIKSLHLKNGKHLKTLSLGMCDKLTELRVESCPKLITMPVGLIQSLNVSLLKYIELIHIENCPLIEMIDVTSTLKAPPTVVIIPQQQMTFIKDECARLADGDSPGANGMGTGMSIMNV
jgi:hypothetical protein